MQPAQGRLRRTADSIGAPAWTWFRNALPHAEAETAQHARIRNAIPMNVIETRTRGISEDICRMHGATFTDEFAPTVTQC